MAKVDRSLESRAILAAHERLVASGLSRERAAARLLPQQSPASAARYLRKLRTGERSGRQIAQREPIRRRLRILVPKHLGGLPGAGDPILAMVNVDTTCGARTANARIPYASISPAAFMASPGYARWVASVERRWSTILGYQCFIEAVTKIRPLSIGKVHAPVTVLHGHERQIA